MTTSTAPTPLLTPSQLATRWDTSTGQLANLRSRGEGPHYLKLGARIHYRAADVETYENARVVLAGLDVA